MLRVTLGCACSLALCCAAVCGAFEQMPLVRHLYIEPFTIKDGSQSLRIDLVNRLRKTNSISVVPDKGNADAFLSGDGEIWIKGYESLNPRSGRLPLAGTPIRTGFVSVELKDAGGNVLWSYLVTPGAGSSDIYKDLSKQISKHLVAALASPGAIAAPRP